MQGKCCSTPGIFAQGLDIRLFTTGCATVERRAWTLEKDTPHTDISPFAYRCIRAIGGSWTERLHADPALKRLGQSWAQLSGHPLRTCPLCRTRPGTPRHVIMACPAMEALVNRLRDDLERALGRVATSPELIQAANRANLTRKVAAEGTAQRWPILSAWKWFVPLSSEIEDFGHDEESSSRAVTNAEQGHDLAYRGIMPQELGRFLRRHGQPTCHRSQPEEDAPDEQFGSFLDLQGAADELAAISVRCVQAVGAAIGPLRLLMLGLRCVRAEYLQRLDAWASAMTVSLNESTAPAGPLLPRPPAAPDRAHIWLRTPEGRSLLKELRWLAPDRHTAVHRLRSVLRSNQSNDRLAEILTEFGAPMRTGAVLSWGASQATWAVYRQTLQHVCRCPVVAPVPLVACCLRCRGAQPAGTAEPQPCPWCGRLDGPSCTACSVTIHFRGGCRWNRGAHAVYRLQAEEAVQLCPDCHWLWIVSYRAFPFAQQLDIPPDISSHMDRVAAQCLPGAGFGSPQVAQSRRQCISRFLARWLRHEWAQLIQAAQDYILRRGSLVLDFELILTQLQQEADRLVQRGLAESRFSWRHRLIRRRS